MTMAWAERGSLCQPIRVFFTCSPHICLSHHRALEDAFKMHVPATVAVVNAISMAGAAHVKAHTWWCQSNKCISKYTIECHAMFLCFWPTSYMVHCKVDLQAQYIVLHYIPQAKSWQAKKVRMKAAKIQLFHKKNQSNYFSPNWHINTHFRDFSS